jgi:hypothetical protein
MRNDSVIDLHERHADAYDSERSRSPRRFDGIVAWDSFFHLDGDDQRNMIPRFARHAEVGAPLLFTSGSAAGEAIGTWCDEPLYHASLDTAEYQRLLAASGFAVSGHVANDPECGGHSRPTVASGWSCSPTPPTRWTTSRSTCSMP